MDLNMSIVDSYTAMKQMDVAQALGLSSMKRAMESFEEEAQMLVDAVNIMTPEHIDVSI